MKKTLILAAVASAACFAALPLHAEEAPAPAPAGNTADMETYAAGYLQAERAILDLITFEDEESVAENIPELQAAILQFRKDYPKPLAGFAKPDTRCPEWLSTALKAEHEMLEEVIGKCRGIDKDTQAAYPEMTQACYAIYEPMLLSHVVLQSQEALVLAQYSAAPTLENAKAVMRDALELTNEESFFYRIGFLYSIFKTHQDKLDELLDTATVDGERSMGAGAVSEALWLLNTEESIAARMAWPTFTDPSPDAQRPDFHKIEDTRNNVEESHLLDCAWGYYDATQDVEVLKSFVRCAVRAAAPENGASLWAVPSTAQRQDVPEELGDVIALTARWSVRSRAKQVPAFAEKVEPIISALSPEELERYNAPLPETASGEYNQK